MWNILAIIIFCFLSFHLIFLFNCYNIKTGGSERRRILVAPSELEEQRGCAVLAFREWIAPLAIKTSRALVVPPRFATLFNFTSVSQAWKTNCGMKEVVHDQTLYNKQYSHLCASNSTTFRLRIEKEWSSGSGMGLGECSKKHQGIDKCVVLKGQASLFDLIKLVPQLMVKGPFLWGLITPSLSFPLLSTLTFSLSLFLSFSRIPNCPFVLFVGNFAFNSISLFVWTGAYTVFYHYSWCSRIQNNEVKLMSKR